MGETEKASDCGGRVTKSVTQVLGGTRPCRAKRGRRRKDGDAERTSG